MTDLPAVSLILPCYRCSETLPRAVESIQRQSLVEHCETLVVYSGWTDSEPPAAFGLEKVIWRRERLLPGAARNLGSLQARGRFLAFLDADVLLDPCWIEQMLAETIRHPNTMLGGFVANANPQSRASRVLHLIEFSEFLPGLAGGVRRNISTSNCFLSAELFRQVGGFDTGMTMSEDWEFCRRLPEPPRFLPDIGIQHIHRSDWEAVRRHLRSLGYWSGRLRKSRPDQSGHWLRYVPTAALGLVGLRFFRIWRRKARARLGPEYSGSGDALQLLAGLWAWSLGFRSGMRGSASPGEQK